MSFGLDYSGGMPAIADMKAAGVTFACRYVGYFSGYNLNAIATPQGKCLTPGEAKTLIADGISPVSNYEWYATRPVDDGFGNRWTVDQAYNAGVWDAHTAETIHVGCGGPAHAAIYFSGDWDFNVNNDGPLVESYFKGVASVIGLARTGAYGSYELIKFLFDNGLITYGWQTYAWSGGAWEPRAHIQQYMNGVIMSGLQVDYDHSLKTDFGQWFPGGDPMLTIQQAANYFVEVDAQHWRCKQTDFIVQLGILEFYRTIGIFQYNGLSLCGLPKSAEVTLKPGVALQRYERVVIVYDPQRQFDNPPGVTGPCYLVHIDSLYKQISDLEAQVATLQQEVNQNKPDPLDAEMRAALTALKPLVAKL